MRRPLALALLLAGAVTACRTAGTAASGATGAAAAPARPSPEAAALLADVRWLSAPERTGRGVGTPGGEAAVEFVADRMRELGLAPAGPDGYLQRFDAPVRAALRGENALAVGDAALALGQEFQPFTFSDDGAVEGELVWAGYGITAPALGWDDYAGLDVKGKIVVVAAHVPREDDPASPFRDPREFHHGEWRTKAANARDHGAAAMIAVRDDWHHPGKDELPAWKGAPQARAGILAAAATLAGLDRAAGLARDLRALAAATAEHRRPHSGPLGARARLAVGIATESAPTANVLGLLPGEGALAGECVVVGAHLDHLGTGGESSLSPERVGEVHPGADDNASGVAALLAIARALALSEEPRPRTFLFAAFAAEELGLLGSAQLVRAPPAACPVERMQLMVNLDMVGRPRDGEVYVDGAATAKGLRERVAAVARGSPLQLAWGGGGYGPSDHTSFYARQVPVLFFFTGAHGDYHRPTDTADKIDPAGLAAVAELALRAARDAAAGPRLEVVRAAGGPPARGGERGYGAYLGTVPDFEERKEPGVLVSGVRPGSPAEKAGLAAGDVLLSLGATRLVSLADLGVALRRHRPGDAVEVSFRRGAEERSATVVLEERR